MRSENAALGQQLQRQAAPATRNNGFQHAGMRRLHLPHITGGQVNLNGVSQRRHLAFARYVQRDGLRIRHRTHAPAALLAVAPRFGFAVVFNAAANGFANALHGHDKEAALIGALVEMLFRHVSAITPPSRTSITG